MLKFIPFFFFWVEMWPAGDNLVQPAMQGDSSLPYIPVAPRH